MRKDEEQHASEATLRRFFRAELSRRDTAGLVRHLLTQCPRCLDTAVAVGAQEGLVFTPDGFQPERFATDPDLYNTTFLSLLRSGEETLARLAREKLRGIGLFALLEEKKREKRLDLIRRDRRFHSWGLFTRLMEKSQEYSRNDPAGGVHLAELAVAVVETLDPEEHKPSLIADFHAAALANLGNARRLAADFEGARTSIQEAWEALKPGTGDPLEEANVVSLEASLLRDLGDVDGAVALLDRAFEIYQELDDTNQQARTLIKQANALGGVDPAQAIPLLQEALALLDSAEHPRLELSARHNLVLYLNDAGQTQEALALLEISRPLYQNFGDAWTQLRLHFVEGRIARALGHLAEAEATFRFVWYDLEARAMHYELTLVSIDLAEVYVAQRKFEPATRLMDDFYPVLKSWGMHAEGLAVWLLLRDAVAKHAEEKKILEAAAFRQTAQYYHRAWRIPLEAPDATADA